VRRRALLAGLPWWVGAAAAQPLTQGATVPACFDHQRCYSGGGVPAGATLDLNFMTPGSLDPRVTFTRASTATYFDATGVMRSAASNAPRWDYDPVTHALKGLLIEESRTNLWLYSADASNAAWLESGGIVAAPVVTGNQVAAPDGTVTAARVVYPAVSGAGAWTQVTQQIAVAANSYAFSVWLRGNVGGERLYLMTTVDAVTYYRQQATLTTAWQRFTLITPSINGGYYWQIGTDLRDVGQTSAPAQTIYIWGGQLETGAFATSYIPTTAAAVTRAADVATVPTGAWFNAAGTGTAAIEFNPSGVAPAAYPRLFADAASSKGLYLNSSLQFGVFDGGTIAATSNAATLGAVSKAAGTLPASSGTSTFVLNGGPSASVALSIGFGSTSTFKLMGDNTAFDYADGYIRHARYWPRALTNAELQSVTR
jgi:hypothetical protein